MILGMEPLVALLWISALLMIAALIIGATVNACYRLYFDAKDEHASKWIKAIGEILGNTADDMLKKLKEKAEEKKE